MDDKKSSVVNNELL